MAEKLTPRKQQALEMRQKIQTVALDLFDRHGFENVSVEMVAQAVGCSVGNIYHYYKSKDELAIQVTSNVDAAYLEMEKEYDAHPEIPAMDKLLDFVGKALRTSVEEPVLYKAFIQAMKYPEQGVLRCSLKRTYFRMLHELISGCVEEGSLPQSVNVEQVVEYLVAIHRGVLLEWRIYEGDFALEEMGRNMVKALLQGLK